MLRRAWIVCLFLLLPAPLAAEPLPRVLSDQDAARYARIFALQTESRWREADREIKALGDPLLMGHVLYQRYMHPTGWRSTYAELHGWMKLYADHPLAEKLHRLAKRRRPASGWNALTAPRTARLSYPDDLPVLVTGPTARAKPAFRRSRTDRRILKQVSRNVLRDRMTVTEKMLATESRRMTPAGHAEARAMLARGHLSNHRFDRVLKQAGIAIQGQGGGKRLGAYYAGLAHWAEDRHIAALEAFRLAAATDGGKLGDVGGAIDYWHARAALRAGLYSEAISALEKAVRWPRDIYGQLAHAQLARLRPYDWTPAGGDRRVIEALMANEPVRRALALMQVGEVSRADMELQRLMRRASREDGALLLLAAGALSAPSSAYRIARIRRANYGEIHDPALYPLPNWRTRGDDMIGRALLLAVARRESGYNPEARSGRGARGLMQLMPGTAGYMAEQNGFPRRELRLLHDPEISLKYGQAYLGYLAEKVEPEGCLIHMLTAYNAGPGNLAKWKKRFGDRNDPLLFLELMGSRETRHFVRDVLAAYWVYRDRLGEPVPSQELLASNRWPRLPMPQTADIAGSTAGGGTDAD